MLKQKIQNIQKSIRKQKLNGLLIGNFGHQVRCDMMYYLLLEHLELGCMYIPARGKPMLWGISFEVPQLKEHHPELSVKAYDKPLHELLSKKASGPTGIRESSLPITALKSLRKIKTCKLAKFKNDEKIYAIKLPEEIKRLERAAKLTDILFSDLVDNWKKFATEEDAANFLLVEMARRGIEYSFPPIVASGKHAANPHHGYEDSKIQKGFCVIDMGVRYKGYCSDMTRTIFVGNPTKSEEELYEKVLEAQTETTKLVQPGKNIIDIDLFCRNHLGKELNKQFIHSLGHGVGTQVHEWPRVSSNVDLELQTGMVITIEPGVYKQGSYGIRIEDDVLITEKGPRILNSSTKRLIKV